MPENWVSAGFGIYIHWPFCAAKCPYCDFNSHVVSRIDHSEWHGAYIREIDRMAELTPNRQVSTVFFGGGTPSLMDPAIVDGVISRIAQRWSLSDGAEISLEANPTSVEAERFRAYSAAGVNRLSLGIQALDDHDLRRLGRLHSVAEALAALDIARSVFQSVSFDLIYARQDQDLVAWENELNRALELAADHLSLYQLTIEDGTAFGDRFRRGGLKGLPEEELSSDLYELTQNLTRDAGLRNYEVSNHARPGAEARHNLIYWKCGDYVGIGPGSHGRLTLDGTRFATEAVSSPGNWLARVGQGEDNGSLVALSEEEDLSERLLMGLRLSTGISVARLEEIELFGGLRKKIEELADQGYLEFQDGNLRTTPLGRALLNKVLETVLA